MRIIHLSDFHLPKSPQSSLQGVKPYATLQAALAEIERQKPQADLIIVGGDLLNDQKQNNYKAVKSLLADIHVPVHVVLGNHDQLASYKKEAFTPLPKGYQGYYSFDIKEQHIVLLYSSGTGRGFGRLDEKQLLWLNEDLRLNQQKSTLIFMHHPPIDIAIPWLDKLKVVNADAFWRILPPHAHNIRGIFVAHIHIQMTAIYRGYLVAGCPATSFQFKANFDSSHAELSEEQPGFNIIDVSKDQLNIRTVRYTTAEPGQTE